MLKPEWIQEVILKMLALGVASTKEEAFEKIHKMRSWWHEQQNAGALPHKAVLDYGETFVWGKKNECADFDRFMDHILISESHRFKK